MEYKYLLYNVGFSSYIELDIPNVNIEFSNFSIDFDNIDESLNYKIDNRIYRLGFTLSVCQKNNLRYYKWTKDDSEFTFVRRGTTYILDTNIDDKHIISAFICNELIADYLYSQNYFLLHASCVGIDGKAFVFIGEPGAGKSTLAASLSQKNNVVISDDLVCIYFDNNKPYVLSGPSYLKLWTSAIKQLSISNIDRLTPVQPGSDKKFYHPNDSLQSKSYELAKIFNLQFSGRRQYLINELRGVSAIEKLVWNCPIPELFLDRQKWSIHAMNIASCVDIHNFARPKNKEAFSKQAEYLLQFLGKL